MEKDNIIELADKKIFSSNDVMRIFEIAQMIKNYGDYKPYTLEETIQMWRKEKLDKLASDEAILLIKIEACNKEIKRLESYIK
jgi:dynactin complex subunit